MIYTWCVSAHQRIFKKRSVCDAKQGRRRHAPYRPLPSPRVWKGGDVRLYSEGMLFLWGMAATVRRADDVDIVNNTLAKVEVTWQLSSKTAGCPSNQQGADYAA